MDIKWMVTTGVALLAIGITLYKIYSNRAKVISEPADDSSEFYYTVADPPSHPTGQPPPNVRIGTAFRCIARIRNKGNKKTIVDKMTLMVTLPSGRECIDLKPGPVKFRFWKGPSESQSRKLNTNPRDITLDAISDPQTVDVVFQTCGLAKLRTTELSGKLMVYYDDGKRSANCDIRFAEYV